MDLVERATGKVVQVPDGEAEAAFRSGQYGIPKGAALPTRTASGTVGAVAAPEAEQAMSAAVGQHVATPEQVAAARQEAAYGGPGGILEAGMAGVGKGVSESFGMPFEASAINLAGLLGRSEYRTDPVTGKSQLIGPSDRTREALAALAALHPIASMAGQGVGMLGATLTGGGALGGLGNLAERGGGIVARGAVEGGMLGGLQAVDEAALGDTDARAEDVIAGLTHGALIGGGTAAGIGLLGSFGRGARDLTGKFVRRLRPEDVEALATSRFGKSADGLGELYAETASAASGADVDAIRALTQSGPAGRMARKVAVYDSEAIQTEAAKAIRSAGDEMLSADKLIAAEAKGALKADYVRKAVMTGNEDAVKSYAAEQIQKVIDGAQSVLDSGGHYPKMIEHVSTSAYRAMEDAMSGDNARAFIALDSLKRDMQSLTKSAYRGVQALADPLDRRAAEMSAKWMDEASSGIRSGLENETLWGKAATDQRTINAAWTKQIDASTRFHRSLTTDVGRDPTNPYLQMRGMDPSKVTSYVRGLTNTDKDLTHQAVRDYIQGSRDLSEAIGKSYDLPPEKLAEIDRLKAAATTFEQHLDKGEKSIVLANQFKALREADSPIGGALTLAGGLVGGPLGAMVGAGLGAVTNPGKMVAQLAAVERLAAEVDTRIGRGVDGFFAAKAGKPAASVQMLEHDAGERKAFEASVKHVRELAAQPEVHAERVGKSVSGIADAAPRLVTAIGMKAAKMTGYLAEHAPDTSSGDTLTPDRSAPLYSDMQMRAWARRASVINDPTVALHSLQRGDITPEEVDALKSQWPSIYSRCQQKIYERLSEPDTRLSREQRLTLQVLFDTPTDGDLRPDAIAAFQASYAAQPEEPRGKPANIKLSAQSATPAQRISGEK